VDLDTLTVDLLVDGTGLRWIDASVVPTDEQFEELSEQARRHVAERVLAALDVSIENVTIDARLSHMYHEAGFLVTFKESPVAPTSSVRIDTAKLQRIAADVGSRKLKVSVCGARSELGSGDANVLATLAVRASRPGVVQAGPNDRPGCQTWTTRTSDPRVAITVATAELPRTGTDQLQLLTLAALSAVAVGVALVGWSPRTRTKHRGE
jgi:hypothetical protein